MRLFQRVASVFGLHFVPDNYMAPVLRGGLYNRVAGPGYFYALPLVDEVKDAIPTAIRGETRTFSEVRTKDGIPLDITLTVRFRFDPRSLAEDIARMLLLAGPQPKTIAILLSDTIEHELRRLTGMYEVVDMWQSEVRDHIEEGLVERVDSQLRRLGVFLRDQTPIIIKDIHTEPELAQTLQAAKRHQILLNVLRVYEEADVDQALMAELVNGLADSDGNVSIMSLGELFGIREARGRAAGPDRGTRPDEDSRVLRFRRRRS